MKGAPARENLLIKKWSTNTFSSTADFTYINEAMRSQLAAQTNVLSAQQVDALADSILRWIQCYSTNSFEVYKRFRFPVAPTPENSAWEPEKMELYKKILAFKKTPVQFSTTNEFDNNMQLTEAFYKAVSDLTKPDGQPTFCLDAWRGVAITNFRVVIKQSQDKDATLSSIIWGEGERNESASTFVGTIYYNPNTITTPAESTLAFVRLYIQVDSKSLVKAYPVYLSLMWSSKYACWLPDTFAAGIAHEGTFMF